MYVFALPRTPASCLNFYQTLRKVAKRAGIAHPELVTSTRLRIYAASMFQVAKVRSASELVMVIQVSCIVMRVICVLYLVLVAY